MIDIPTPCKNEVEKYLKKWDSLENYVLQEKSLDKLFFITYPNNNEIEDILIKVSSLNDFYSTNIFSVFPVAKHILNLGIDNRLKSNDETLVNDIANLSINHCLILITISILLTLISGFFPSRIAAKKDPVNALRSE